MLPFIAGLATGVVAVVAYKNNKKIKTKIEEGACSVKELAKTGFERSKEAVAQVKQRFEEPKEALKVEETEVEIPKQPQLKKI